MSKVLRIKHWHIFLAIILISVIDGFKTDDYSTFDVGLTIIQFSTIIGWIILTGHELHNHVPANISLNYNLYIFNCFICLAVPITFFILSDGKEYHGQGLEALPVFYMFYAYLHLHAFPVKALKSIELNRKAKLSEYLGDFFLLLFWPIGIWFLQPRINRVHENEQTSVAV